MFVRIGEQVVDRNNHNSEIFEPSSEVTRGVQSQAMQWPVFLGMTVEGPPPHLQCGQSTEILERVASHEEGGETRAVSWHQLYVDFLLKVGHVGVVKKQKQWQTQVLPAPTLEFLSSSRALSQYVHAVADELGTPIQSVHRRPVSSILFTGRAVFLLIGGRTGSRRLRSTFLILGGPLTGR